MRRKLSLITMLFAWFFATGSHWDLVQTFAWGRMIATYAQSMPLAQAVKLTFTPDNLCEVCHAVSLAKQQDHAPAPTLDGVASGKIPLIAHVEPAFVITLDESERERIAQPGWATRDRVQPPTPPPRAHV